MPLLSGNAGQFGAGLQSAGTTIKNTVNSVSNKYMGFANAGSGAANAVSRQAQENQFAFNSAEAALQRDYNTQMWEEQKNFNSAEAEKNRAFQASEAEKTRQWQEHLANTSYQRAVEDLKKAGLNPILAYMNGATTPNGATASGSQASSGLQSGAAASGSNYTGQGHNMSESLAILGAIGSLIGDGITAMGAYLMDANNNGPKQYGFRDNKTGQFYGVETGNYQGFMGYHPVNADGTPFSVKKGRK